MTNTNPIHPDVRKIAIETGAEKVRPMRLTGAGRIQYDGGSVDIIHIGKLSKFPDDWQCNLSFGPRPTIDVFPE